MGWEWHNRDRKEGRFRSSGMEVRLRVCVTPQQYNQIVGRAYARQMSISEYIRDLVQRDMLQARYGIDPGQ